MSTAPSTIKLSPRRLVQLRSIASALDLSITDTIAALIREKIVAGVIPPDLPGVIVRRVGEKVSIQIDEKEAATVTLEIASKIADALCSVADGGSAIVNPSPFKRADSFGISRKGTGVLAQIPFHGPGAEKWSEASSSFTPGEARDLAGLIRQAAA